MKRKSLGIILLGCAALVASSCTGAPSSSDSVSTTSSSETSSSSSLASQSGSSTSETSSSQTSGVWNYSAKDIASFGSGTPAGTAFYDNDKGYAVIWNTDASLDNYGGIQTPTLALDFSKAVYFEMSVVGVNTEYIVKLAVAGQSESYYVLADESSTGVVSVNVVNAMLCAKFRARDTQPDPGYASGWTYAGQKVNCAFNILAKGPDGQSETAELDLGYLKISNNIEAVTGVSISASQIQSGTISALKNSPAISLAARVTPSTIADQSVLWQSDDESIAAVDVAGNLSFVGVGKTEIYAESSLDQSVSASLAVNVLSGYEAVSDLKTALSGLTYGGSTVSSSLFDDLYATTWSSSMGQSLSVESLSALATHLEGNETVVENAFDPSVSTQLAEAKNHEFGGVASFGVTLALASSATVYRSIGGKLFSETYGFSLKAAYATESPSWAKSASYLEKGLVVKLDGTVSKYSFSVKGVDPIGSYLASNLMDSTLWVIPDRTKISQDATVNSLSPASRTLDGSVLVLKQNKYAESKYCFGGIVSNLLTADEGKAVQTLIDVTAVNQMSDYVKTMWEIRILYYKADGVTPVSTTPIKVDGDNEKGFFVHTFTPAYTHFRLYLVVNGSDIGAQFADAEIRLDSLKLYSVL